MGIRIELLSSRAQRVAREGVGATRLPLTSGLATRSARAYMATSQCAGATQPHALTTGQLGQGGGRTVPGGVLVLCLLSRALHPANPPLPSLLTCAEATGGTRGGSVRDCWEKKRIADLHPAREAHAKKPLPARGCVPPCWPVESTPARRGAGKGSKRRARGAGRA